MNIKDYKKILSTNGSNLSQVRRNQSDTILNTTFNGDVNYKKVYILSKDGWKFEDAKYQKHTTPSILKDNVDYYLQFRPKVHYPIGTYVIIPDDSSFDINLSDDELENPFNQDVSNRTEWWLIVGRTDSDSYVRYSVLKCNWNFQWIYDGKIQSCYGCSRNANSYTSGQWTDEYTTTLDNLTSAWLPDIYHVYKDNYESLGMCDGRTIMYGVRFMITNNDIDPKVYSVSKIIELAPKGILKLTLKQDDFNPKRDNVELKICDYYNDTGNDNISDESSTQDVFKTSTINWIFLNEDGKLDESAQGTEMLTRGVISYFKVEFSDNNIVPKWSISINNDELTDDEKDYYIGLIKVEKPTDNILSVKPAKAGSLVGMEFTLSVSDSNGEYYSSIPIGVEVSE